MEKFGPNCEWGVTCDKCVGRINSRGIKIKNGDKRKIIDKKCFISFAKIIKSTISYPKVPSYTQKYHPSGWQN